VSNRCENLLVVTTVLLLKTMSNKMRFKVLNRTIRASLDLVCPLARDLGLHCCLYCKSKSKTHEIE
jgi:hypothetical protein